MSHRYAIPLAAFLAILPLLIHGPTCGHDFDFHLLSWLEAATQYVHGQYPHWAYTPAFNAGEPRFLFYPPISWTLGALLTLLLPIQYVATAYTFLALTLAGFTAHRLAMSLSKHPGAPSFRVSPERVGCSPLQATTPGAPRLASETWVSTSPRSNLNPTLCAILYLLNPYMLFTAYERSAFAELLAAAFLPLLFQAALTTHPNPGKQIRAIAIPLALIWLTNAPAAVMSTYALALLTLTRLALGIVSARKRPQPLPPGCPMIAEQSEAIVGALPSGCPMIAEQSEAIVGAIPSARHLTATTLLGTTVGLLLPAFYLLPAAYERRYVQIALATIEGMRPQDHFLFHRMPGQTPDDLFHNAVVQTASLISLLLLAAVAALYASALDSETWVSTNHNPTHTAKTLLPLTLLIAFLLTPLSLPLWNHIPQLLYLQFPWRLNALLAVIALSLAAQIRVPHPFESHPKGWGALPSQPQLRVPHVSILRRGFYTLLLAAALTLPAYTLFHQPCDAHDAPQARAALFHSPLGTEPTDEYTPAAADNDSLQPHDPPYWLADEPNALPPTTAQPDQAPQHIKIAAPDDEFLILNRRSYPIWLLTLNGHPAPILPRDDGLIAVAVPRGSNTLSLTYHRTLDQLLGLIVSALALATLIFLVKPPKRPQTL